MLENGGCVGFARAVGIAASSGATLERRIFGIVVILSLCAVNAVIWKLVYVEVSCKEV